MNIFIDIETIPTSNQVIKDRAAANVAPPGNYKNPDAIAKWWAETGNQLKLDVGNKTALDGTWGELLMIGMAVDDSPVEVLVRNGDESGVLVALGEALHRLCSAHVHAGVDWQQFARWIGHNIQDFDLRFLWQRQKVLNVNLPFKLPVGKPNYNSGPYVYDTMKEWAGYGNRIKQTDLELAFGITRDDEITGADVAQMYADGKIDVIENHCRQDVENLRTIYRRMNG